MVDFIKERLLEIISRNLENTGVQIYVKSQGDAWINPINYKLEDVYSFARKDDKGRIVEKQFNCFIGSKK